MWAAQVPSWFWLMFGCMFLVACLGTAAILHILRELRRQKRGQRLSGSDTGMALDDLSRRIGRRGQ